MSGDMTAALTKFDIVVLEGCDGTGKTTLANALETKFGHVIVHSGRTPDGEDLIRRYRQILATPGKIVLDRSFISELVYGPVYRGRSRITLPAARSLARIVAERKGALVHLTGNPGVLAGRLRSRDGTAPPADQIRALTDAYRAIFAQLHGTAPVITIDTTTPSAGRC